MPIHAPLLGVGGGLAHFPQMKMMSLIVLSKKDRPLAETRHLSHNARISVARFELGVAPLHEREKRTGQDSIHSNDWPLGRE